MLHQFIMKNHTTRWNGLSAASKDHYDKTATLKQAERRSELALESDTIKHKLEKLRSKIDMDKSASKPMTMNCASWGDRELQLFAVLSKSSHFAEGEVATKRKASEQAPKPTLPAMLQLLRSQDIKEEPSPSQPSWVSQIAARRSSFRSTGLLVDTENGEVLALKFLFAVILPGFVALSRLTPCDEWLPHHDDMMLLAPEDRCAKPAAKFLCDWSSLVRSEALSGTSVANIRVLPCLVHAKGREVHCHSEPVDLQTFLDNTPLDKKARLPKEGGETTRAKRQSLYADCPAMEDAVNRARRKTAATLPLVQASSSSDDEPLSDGEPLPDDAADDVFNALAMKRAEMYEKAPAPDDDFKVDLVGGPATMKRSGLAYDGVEAAARGQDAVDFCIRHHLPRHFSCKLPMYDEHIAGILCRAWCHKMQWCLNTTKHSTVIIVTAASIEAYGEPTEFTSLTDDPNCTVHARKRMTQIRNLFS